MKSPKQKTIGWYKKKLWKVFSEYIRRRDEGVCFTCRKKDNWKNTDAGHYVSRSAGNSLYFDERNVHCQCKRCNIFMKGNLDVYALRLIEEYGIDILPELAREKERVVKLTIPWYKERTEFYKSKIEVL